MLAEKRVVILLNFKLLINLRWFMQSSESDIKSIREINTDTVGEIVFVDALKGHVNSFGVPVAFSFLDNIIGLLFEDIVVIKDIACGLFNYF